MKNVQMSVADLEATNTRLRRVAKEHRHSHEMT
jgi:hypothetical protein